MNLICVNTNILVGGRSGCCPSEYMSWFWEASATWPGKAELPCLLYHTGEREVERGMRLQDHPTGGVRPVARCSQTHIQHRPCPSPVKARKKKPFPIRLFSPLGGCRIGRGCGLPHLLYFVLSDMYQPRLNKQKEVRDANQPGDRTSSAAVTVARAPGACQPCLAGFPFS